VKIAAVIPTLGERPELMQLTTQLVADGVDMITLGRPHEHNIHTTWNAGAHLALGWKADYIAILNDDIKLPARTLATLQTAMHTYDYACAGVDPTAKFGLPANPRITPVTGNVGDLMVGVTTWCFMVRASAWVDIDEQYKWWYGVGDLFTKIIGNGGRLGRVTDLGIIHVGSATAARHPWTQEAKRQDGQRWRELH